MFCGGEGGGVRKVGAFFAWMWEGIVTGEMDYLTSCHLDDDHAPPSVHLVFLVHCPLDFALDFHSNLNPRSM